MKKAQKLVELILDLKVDEACAYATSIHVGEWKDSWGENPHKASGDAEAPDI